MNSLRICIVGGSITGCTLAISALRHNMQPDVFEASNAVLKDRGAGLAIPTAVALTMRDDGLIPDGFPHVSIRAISHVSASSEDTQAGVKAGDIPTFVEAIRWGHLYDQLRGLVPDNIYHAGVTVTEARNDGNQVIVSFDNGTTARYDLVVFADGYQSLGRSLICPSQQPEYQGYFLWRGTVAEGSISNSAAFEASIQRVGFSGGHFFSYLLPDAKGSTAPGERELNWGMFVPLSKAELRGYLVDRNTVQQELTLAPGQMRPELEHTLKAGARELLPGYFADLVTSTENTFGQGIVAVIPDTYHAGRICLAGDAGALLPPFTTSGVFKGMKNATELITTLASADNLTHALDVWSRTQQQAGAGFQSLTNIMTGKLITQVPDFSNMSQDELLDWWSEVQTTLEEVMG